MSAGEPTEGPWLVDGPASAANPNIGLWSVEGRGNVANQCTLFDAHLISTAPDGLALAEMIVELVDPAALVEDDLPGQSKMAPALRAAHALIAKARGQ